MNFVITGESGFIGSNLPIAFKRLGHTFYTLLNHPAFICLPTGEPCVHRNSEDVWAAVLKENNIKLVIHNAAAVGTDVVALNPNEASLTNVAGTHNICRAAERAGAAVSYMGTTVVYNTALYQRMKIHEQSEFLPKTLYGAQKMASEYIVRSTCSKWNIIRPLFAYGGVGDMNSLIAKTLYAAHSGRDKIDMFLDPNKIKDYMHVSDYCDAVALCCHNGLWGIDYNVAAENPQNTGEILEMMSEVCGRELSEIVQWHPETDYLGNHRLLSKRFRDATGWEPKYTLLKGIQESWESILQNDGSYDPLIHLDEADRRGLDLTQFY
jgi:dTDP-glucose 4,6-dehydratase